MKTKIKEFFNKEIVKNILKGLLIFISLLYFVSLQTFINSGFLTFGLIPILVTIVIALIYLIVKRKNITKINSKELPSIIVNNLTLGIFINIIFIILLSLIVNEVSYVYSFGNYAIYKNAPNWMYLVTSILLLPVLRNILVRRNIKFIKNLRVKKVLSIVFVLVICFTSPTLINGIYLGLVALILNNKYIKEENLLKITLEEILISLSLSTMTLYLATYKIPMMIVMILSVLICFVLNLTKFIQKKEEV